jgi:hypothetical protein
VRHRWIAVTLGCLICSACFQGEFLEGLDCSQSSQCAPSYVCVFPTSTQIADGADPFVGECGHPADPVIPDPAFFGGTVRAFGDDPDLVGVALLVRDYEKTRASLQVSGLLPNTEYPAHVHARYCDEQEGGDEYKHDPRLSGADEYNELWLTLNTDDNGSGLNAVTHDGITRVDARSVVVHAPADIGPRVACADLIESDPPDRFDSGGSIVTVLPPAMNAGLTAIVGSASMERRLEGGTTITVQFAGLTAPMQTQYTAIVHQTRCAVAGGSTAYKINRSVSGRIASNELRLEFEVNDAGAGSAEMNFADHIARADAQSIVVHTNPVDPGWACIDLVPLP